MQRNSHRDDAAIIVIGKVERPEEDIHSDEDDESEYPRNMKIIASGIVSLEQYKASDDTEFVVEFAASRDRFTETARTQGYLVKATTVRCRVLFPFLIHTAERRL